jgi:hypothetical protein
MTDTSEKKDEKMWRDCGASYSFENLKEKWPSPFVSRDRIEEFTDGLFKQHSLNVLDARGDGITPRYCRGSKIFYEMDDVITWLKTKTKTKNMSERKKCLKN